MNSKDKRMVADLRRRVRQLEAELGDAESGLLISHSRTDQCVCDNALVQVNDAVDELCIRLTEDVQNAAEYGLAALRMLKGGYMSEMDVRTATLPKINVC